MTTSPLQWTDHAGLAHQLRLAHDLSTDERQLLTNLRQQTANTALLLEAGYDAPAISLAAPNMMRMMLRLLLPHVVEHEIATFDITEGHDLLTQWWAIADTAR
jgi:hypothetical protein